MKCMFEMDLTGGLHRVEAPRFDPQHRMRHRTATWRRDPNPNRTRAGQYNSCQPPAIKTYQESMGDFTPWDDGGFVCNPLNYDD